VDSRTSPIVFVEEKKFILSAGNQTSNHPAIIRVTIPIPNKIHIKFYLNFTHKVAIFINEVAMQLRKRNSQQTGVIIFNCLL
jgi:hypothetical protein